MDERRRCFRKAKRNATVRLLERRGWSSILHSHSSVPIVLQIAGNDRRSADFPEYGNCSWKAAASIERCRYASFSRDYTLRSYSGKTDWFMRSEITDYLSPPTESYRSDYRSPSSCNRFKMQIDNKKSSGNWNCRNGYTLYFNTRKEYAVLLRILERFRIQIKNTRFYVQI